MVFIQVAKVRSRADRKTAEPAMFIHSRSSDCAEASTAGKTIAVTNTVRPSRGGANRIALVGLLTFTAVTRYDESAPVMALSGIAKRSHFQTYFQ